MRVGRLTVQDQLVEKAVGAAAATGAAVTAVASFGILDLVPYFQAFAFLGSGLAGIGAFFYYVRKKHK